MMKKISIKTIAIIFLIGIIIALILIIFNMKTTNIEEQIASKEQLTETTSSNAYVDMATHLSEMENAKIDMSTITQNTVTKSNAETNEAVTASTTLTMTGSGTIIVFGNAYVSGGTAGTSFTCTLNGTKVTVNKTSAVISYQDGDVIKATASALVTPKVYAKYARISWVYF